MIDVIFPVYVADEENAELQRECFSSFRKHTPGPYRVIVVDNGSRYGTGDAQAVADVYVRLPDPVGFARAVNIGWKLCEADLICVANNDLIFDAGWLPPLTAMIEAGEADAVAPSDGTDWEIWSSCFILRAETRERIGWFDDVHLPWRSHDQDYWIRAMKAGYRFRRSPDSTVIHRESATFNKMDRTAEMWAEARILIGRYGVMMAQEWRRLHGERAPEPSA